MKVTITPSAARGIIEAPPSKSMAHRLLICAGLAEGISVITNVDLSRDIEATIACLRALGARIEYEKGRVNVRGTGLAGLNGPGTQTGAVLPCGESGTTLRLLLPLAGALGARVCFRREGRLWQRPLSPLDRELCDHGMRFAEDGELLYAEGSLRPGDYRLPGNVSSQFVSGLLLALPLLEGESRLTVTEPVESAAYIRMTEDALRLGGLRFAKEKWNYSIPGGQRPALSGAYRAEGDWSNAAFFLCMGALSEEGLRVRGLLEASSQGDRAVLELLRGFGALVETGEDGILVRRGALRGQVIDAAPIPDLIPVLSVLAAGAEGETRIVNAGRLRLKESDRLKTTAALLRDLGGTVEELKDGLVIHGRGSLRGGAVESAGDHRIAMSAAVASCLCREPVELSDGDCVAKSYPGFWDDFETLRRGS